MVDQYYAAPDEVMERIEAAGTDTDSSPEAPVSGAEE
jgi:hypothetical protein